MAYPEIAEIPESSAVQIAPEWLVQAGQARYDRLQAMTEWQATEPWEPWTAEFQAHIIQLQIAAALAA